MLVRLILPCARLSMGAGGPDVSWETPQEELAIHPAARSALAPGDPTPELGSRCGRRPRSIGVVGASGSSVSGRDEYRAGGPGHITRGSGNGEAVFPHIGAQCNRLPAAAAFRRALFAQSRHRRRGRSSSPCLPSRCRGGRGDRAYRQLGVVGILLRPTRIPGLCHRPTTPRGEIRPVRRQPSSRERCAVSQPRPHADTRCARAGARWVARHPLRPEHSWRRFRLAFLRADRFHAGRCGSPLPAEPRVARSRGDSPSTGWRAPDHGSSRTQGSQDGRPRSGPPRDNALDQWGSRGFDPPGPGTVGLVS